MTRTGVLVIVTVALCVLSGARPHACSCIGPTAACSSVWDYPDVFVATVNSVGERQAVPGRLGESRTVTMRIGESLKGTASGVVPVITGQGGGDCGYAFEVGRTYLVYAYRLKDTNELGTGICTRTAPVEQASGDLIFLRGAFREPASVGTIQGDVKRIGPTGPGGGDARTPLPGITVVLEGDGQHQETVSGPDGLFSFRVPAGTYLISARAPDGWYSWHDEPRPIELRDVRGCALVSIGVQPNGRIAGRLLDATGRAAPFVTVEAVLASDLGRPSLRPIEKTLTDVNGEYEIRHLPAGEYLIGLSLDRDAKDVGDNSVWFPTGAMDAAWRQSLENGQRLVVNDVVLPASVVLATVAGTVIGVDGRATAGASVYVLAPSGGGIVAGPVQTDASGQFRLTVVAGREYRLSAEQGVTIDNRGTLHRAEVSRFTATPGQAPYRLKLQVG